MRRRAPLAALLTGVAVAGFLAIGLVQAAGSGPDLGEPVVVSPAPVDSTRTRQDRAPTGEPPSSIPTSTSIPTSASAPAASATPEPTSTKRPAITPSERTAKVEPVRPPSPRPGGDDDDDDDGGDDD
ncbi:hypothetical protein ACIBQX_46575 [Nonomuraea sp. NPDC049714]|uniref:hypothetical protein n=1 Tax=Nonomuraea sp. NPDC049714 TaxID=3364357 RepID=UPI003799FF8C